MMGVLQPTVLLGGRVWLEEVGLWGATRQGLSPSGGPFSLLPGCSAVNGLSSTQAFLPGLPLELASYGLQT